MEIRSPDVRAGRTGLHAVKIVFRFPVVERGNAKVCQKFRSLTATYQSACTFCFRVEIRHYVSLPSEQAELKSKLARRLCFACEAKPAVISFTSRVLLFPGNVIEGSTVCKMSQSVHSVWQSWRTKPHSLGLTTMQAC
jgi:hypothetical protein